MNAEINIDERFVVDDDFFELFYELVDIDDVVDDDEYVNMIDISVTGQKTFTLASGIVSHNSASGGLIKCLGRKGNAFYALKGVPLNVLEVSHQKFMANKELSELYSIITTFPDAEICIATDADADGSRIRGLVSLFMHKFFPDRLNNGLMKILRTPIAIGKKNNRVQDWAYTFGDVNKIDSKLDVSYVKGLGSWSVRDLQDIIAKDTMDEMLPVVSIQDTELFTQWFSGSTIDYRKEQILQAAPFDVMRI